MVGAAFWHLVSAHVLCTITRLSVLRGTSLALSLTGDTRDSCERGWRPQGYRRMRLAPTGAVRRAWPAGRMPSSEVGAAPYRPAEAAPGAAPVRGPTLTTADGQLFSSPIGTADRRGGREGGESSEPLRLGWSAPYPCRSGSSRCRASPRRHPLQQVHAHRHLRDVDGTCHLLAAP